MTGTLPLDAFLFGLISAASLPLGALLSFVWTPRSRVVAALMAFGGGALLAALTIDLAAPSVERGQFYQLAIGCIIGGLLFDLLNMIVNNQGGFLRKTATTVHYLRKQKMQGIMHVYQRLSRVPLFHHLPKEELKSLLPYVSHRVFKNGNILMQQGEPGDALFIIESGEVDIVDNKDHNKRIARLRRDDVFGEMAILTGEMRSATAQAIVDTKVWMIHKKDFDHLLSQSPELAEHVQTLVKERIEELRRKNVIDDEMASDWAEEAAEHIDHEHIQAPTEHDIKKAHEEHSGAPLAIWLGILLDGIPESLVIGASLINAGHHAAEGDHGTAVASAGVSLSLIAGLFLSNFPESLSSSVGMREQGYSKKRIFIMWASLMLFTGAGALLGYYLFQGLDHSHSSFSIVEGIAAGAMLVMIAETMMPEAAHKGGAIVGFSTLMGFLAAVFFKTLQ